MYVRSEKSSLVSEHMEDWGCPWMYMSIKEVKRREDIGGEDKIQLEFHLQVQNTEGRRLCWISLGS